MATGLYHSVGPQIQVLIAFPNAPFDAISGLVWTDISDSVIIDPTIGGQPIAINRGRQYELDKIQAGTLTLTLDNRDRRFDPENTAGPYYPNVIPTKRIQVRAFWASTTYYLYTGYIESLVPDDLSQTLNLVRLTAVDAFKPFNYLSITQTEFANNSASQIIGDMLNTAGWPAADRDLGSTSTSTQIPAQTWTNQLLLPTIQTIATADGGSFFMGPNGITTYHDRYYGLRNATIQATFGDSQARTTLNGALNNSATTITVVQTVGFPTAGTVIIDSEQISYTGTTSSTLTGCTRGANSTSAASHSSGAAVVMNEISYVRPEFSYDDTRLINHAEVTRAGGTVQTADDTASQTTYGKRANQITGLQITTDTEALSRAQYMVALYAYPYLRVKSLALNGELSPALAWPQILGRALDDKIAVIRRPPGGGAAINKQARIQAITHSIDINQWLTTWQLSPVQNEAFWTVQDSVNGVLDSTTRLAY